VSKTIIFGTAFFTNTLEKETFTVSAVCRGVSKGELRGLDQPPPKNFSRLNRGKNVKNGKIGF